MNDNEKVQCVRCRGVFSCDEVIDVHITMCIGHKHYPHNPVWMCKGCLAQALEDIKAEFGTGVSYES